MTVDQIINRIMGVEKCDSVDSFLIFLSDFHLMSIDCFSFLTRQTSAFLYFTVSFSGINLNT